jgi:predicted nucleic acid-binding protein
MPVASLRVLLDTNVYGILAESASPDFLDKIGSSERVTVYGFSVVRKELRDIPRNLQLSGKGFRSVLLNYYDSLVGKHDLPLTRLIEVLAEEYFSTYSGGISRKKLENDFLIVACASIHGLDVLVSNDEHSMFSKKALEAFEKVNSENGLRTPKFYSLEQFKTLV